jgi:hypothetical protein
MYMAPTYMAPTFGFASLSPEEALAVLTLLV